MEFQNLNILSGIDIISVMFKSFAIIIAFIYLFYSLVISKQTQVMNKTLQTAGSDIFRIVSSIQITLALVLLILAIFLL